MSAEVDQSLREFVARAMILLAGRPLSHPSAQQTAEAPDPVTFLPLAGDGSHRKVYRVSWNDMQAIAVSNPLPPDRTHPDENEGFLAVREHLHQRRVRVPAFYAGEIDKGFLLLEDLGDLRLCDLVRTRDWETREDEIPLSDIYKEALRSLIRMQQPGTPTFRTDTVSNPAYTEDFVLDQESGYFHRELVLGMAGRTESFERIGPECRRLARTAIVDSDSTSSATPDALVFMHRDFQSRNLMVVGPALAVIDFQGARLGPAEYDLAALLYDPYVAMPEPTRMELIRFYASEASRVAVPGIPDSPSSKAWPTWERRMLANAANRLMQALGAYAKLGGRFQRPGFLEHIPQGLHHLEVVLTSLDDCPMLLALVRDLRSLDLGR